MRKKRYCLNCEKELINRQSKYCSSECQIDFQYKKYIDDWKSGLVDGMRGEYQLSSYIHKYIRNKFNNKCCECGWDKVNPVTGNSPLEIHHKDGNYKNNLEENLVLLCPNCHSLTSTYKNTACHEGRKDRSKYYKHSA